MGRTLRWLAVAVALVAAAWVVLSGVAVLRTSSVDRPERSGAIVVLGAAQYDGRPSPALRRGRAGPAALYRNGTAPRIVLTGAKAPGDRFTEAFAGYRYLVRAGVPGDDLTIVDDGTSSWESLAATRRVLRRLGVRDVVLVSDPYHSQRLLDIAAEVGLSATVSPTGAGSAWQQVARETLLVSAGRVVGYRRLLRAEQ